MYGLTSRESLSKRQSRWLRDVDGYTKTNPAQNALNKNEATTLKDKPDLINIVSGTPDQVTRINRPLYVNDESNIKDSYTELSERCNKLE